MLFLKNFDNDLSVFDEFGRAFGKSSFMATDLVENDDNYELSVSLPGVQKKDIAISANNGYLTVSVSESGEEKEDKKSRYIMHERYSRNASRSFYVGDISEADIKAKLNDGILNIIVPKAKAQEQKLIEIE